MGLFIYSVRLLIIKELCTDVYKGWMKKVRMTTCSIQSIDSFHEERKEMFTVISNMQYLLYLSMLLMAFSVPLEISCHHGQVKISYLCAL